MLGYYSNSNAKPGGSNINNKKIQTLISSTFHKYLSWLTYTETRKSMNKYKIYTNTENRHSHIYRPTNK